MLLQNFSPWPSFSEEEAEATRRVILSGKVNYWTGEECRLFESAFAKWSGTSHAVSLANGTLALDVALKALGIGEGDEVVVTPRTFIASVSSVVNAGARPVFAEVDAESGNITLETIAAVLTRKTRAIIPVHLAGWPCDMPGIMALAEARGLKVIEDCAQAHGAMVGEKSVGSFGDVGAWSFCQDKIMTTGGEGGMVTLSDEALWSTIWSYKDHGKSWDAVYNRTHQPGFRWVHESFGTNWRMLEVQGAIGRIQLTKMPGWTQRRTEIANRLSMALQAHADLVRTPLPDARAYTHAFYRLYSYVRPDALKTGWSRDRMIAALNEMGAPVYHGSCAEVYREKAFAGTGLAPPSPLPIAQQLGETSLMFLTHPTITDTEVDHVCAAIDSVMTSAKR